MILVAKFGEANHELHCDFKITAQPKKEYFDGDYEVEITENGTTTFATEGKFCDQNIAVSVNVPTGETIADAFISGTISGAYRNDRVTTVRQSGISYTNVTSIDLPNVTTLKEKAITYNNNLIEVNLPKWTPKYSDSMYGVSWNSALQSVSFPSATELPMYACHSNKSLVNIYVPLVERMNSYSFTSCYSLEKIDMPSLEACSNAFEDCYSLKAIILRKNKVCKQAWSSPFRGCYHILGTVNATYNPEGLKDGYIYVPKNLIEQYKVATNWATYADQFRAIEDYPEITGG